MISIYSGDISQAYVCFGTGLRAPYLKVRQIAGMTGLPFAEVSHQLLADNARLGPRALRPTQAWLDMTSAEQIGALLKARQTATVALSGDKS